MIKHLQVAVGVIVNAQQEVLIARRQAHQHQGNLWEFPGGKREPEESRLDALKRELQEEVGLLVEKAEDLFQVEHDYTDRKVTLDVWLVEQFSGEIAGREGQEIKWCPLNALDEHEFPAANSAIVSAVKSYYQN
ncbi:8-oxo-dGTP diphosphatase MutT [Methylophaga sp. OBS3]|uniref:8-oxo-dGTP diphosphatase MutT n=1 Tax=Methylophaga sp. OBS3 TaxID=2991934 RepID=UPI0022501E28|nr:8-oxo-dGTP diphosphatase MutT [Methylophaga sp. OBS3]MCX4190774.1 8-oxo-dGTP diphosphatase MutT [Methylophaga sp. OBS3]